MAEVAQLNLRVPSEGLPGVTTALFRVFIEAARVVLSDVNHRTGTMLAVQGEESLRYRLKFRPPTQQQIRSHADPNVATEWAACAIAFLIVPRITSCTVIRRSYTGTAIDYWLGPGTKPFFQETARLEVSGIRRGTDSQLRSRISEKLRRAEKIQNPLPLYVSVTEFGEPRSHLVRNDPK